MKYKNKLYRDLIIYKGVIAVRSIGLNCEDCPFNFDSIGTWDCPEDQMVTECCTPGYDLYEDTYFRKLKRRKD